MRNFQIKAVLGISAKKNIKNVTVGFEWIHLLFESFGGHRKQEQSTLKDLLIHLLNCTLSGLIKFFTLCMILRHIRHFTRTVRRNNKQFAGGSTTPGLNSAVAGVAVAVAGRVAVAEQAEEAKAIRSVRNKMV
jgi:hypothetical protein